MGSKKRAVKAKCANMQKAREVVAQRRAAEAAGPREVEAQAEAIAAEAEAQADAGADEADAQLHQLQADPQHSEQQLAHNQRMQHLQQQLQDLQRSELQRKEQQLADLEAQQRAALLQWEQQLIERQHQLEQQQADLSRREQDLTERQHQLQQQQADLDSREQQQARIQTLPQQLHSLQQELKAQQVAEVQRMVQQQLAQHQHLLQQQQADLLLMQQQVEMQAISYNHPLPDPSPCSRAKLASPLQGHHIVAPALSNPTQPAPSSPSCLPPPPLHGGTATELAVRAWARSLTRYLSACRMPEPQWVPYAAGRLTGGAEVWWFHQVFNVQRVLCIVDVIPFRFAA